MTNKSWMLMLFVLVSGMTPAPFALSAHVGGDDITYSPKGVGKVTFRHEFHVKQQGMDCNSCHYKTFQMAGRDSYSMDMAALTKGKFCGSCHDGSKAFNVTEQKNCKRCHKG